MSQSKMSHRKYSRQSICSHEQCDDIFSHVYPYVCENKRAQIWEKKYKKSESLEIKKLILTKLIQLDSHFELTTAVLNFYLQKQSETLLKNDYSILNHSGICLEKILQGQDFRDKNKLVLITSFTQQGKTFLALALMALHIACGHCVIMNTVYTKHTKTFLHRQKEEFGKLQKHLEKQGFEKEIIQRFEPFVYIGSDLNLEQKTEAVKQMHSLINGKKIGGIVTCKHYTQLKKIFENKNSDVKIVSFIDEAHKLGGYIKSNKEVKYNTFASKFRDIEFVYRSYLITATPHEIYWNEENLWARSIVKIPVPESYVGVFDTEWVTYPNNDTILKCSEKSIQLNSNWLKACATESQKTPYKRIDKFGNKGYHPVIMLSFIEYINDRQRSLITAHKKGIIPANDEHKIVINANWTWIVFNQEGIKLYHSSLTEPIEGVFGKDGEYHMKKWTVEYALTWLYNHGGVERFPRILVLAYKQAEESNTFCSLVTQNPKEDANWHPTSVELFGLREIPVSRTVQKIGRGTFNSGDMFIASDSNNQEYKVVPSPCFYATEMIKEQVFKCIEFNIKDTFDIETKLEEGKNFCVQNFVRNKYHLKNRIPKRALGKDTFHMKTIRNPNQYIEKHITQKLISPALYLTLTDVRLLNSISTNRHDYNDVAEQIRNDICKLGEIQSGPINLEKVKRSWESKQDNYVKRIITEFIKNKFQTMSENELKKKCGEKLKIDNYDKWDMRRHNKYKIIELVTNTNLYHLCDNIKTYLNL
jgi:hypothetical protein